MVTNHRGAGARRANDRVVVRENLDESTGHRSGVRSAARVGHRLATASLPRGIVHLHPQSSRQFQRGNRDLWKKLVDVTGNEKGDRHAMSTRSLVDMPRSDLVRPRLGTEPRPGAEV